MPHGGYHGTVVMGGNVVQQGYQKPDGSYGISGGIDDRSRLDFNPPQSNQNNQTAAQLEQQIKNQMSGGAGVDGFEGEPIDPREAYIAAQANAGILSNLLRKEQEEKLRNDIIAQATISPVDIEQGFGNTGVLNKSNLTGFEGGLFGFNTGPNIGGTTYPIAAETVNPITGEKIITRKAREGLSTPDYNKFIQALYDANPELYQETFPLESGQALKPLFVRIGEGIMGLPGASQIGQLASSVISPLSGLFTGQRTATPKIQYDNMGNAIGIIPETSGGSSGDPQAVPEGIDMSIYGSFIGKPGPFIGNIIDQDQDGVDDRFQSGPGEAKAPPYSPLKQPVEQLITTAGLPALADYASMAPQFTGSEYTNQGVSPEFLENLRRFYG